MIEAKRGPGRPRKEHPLDGATRSKRLRAKRTEEGTKELRLVIDTSTEILDPCQNRPPSLALSGFAVFHQWLDLIQRADADPHEKQ
ncbi:hypothetical protein [Aeromonas veronii]|uniref:hypothetical protein n=1 Tax=Aeromonas veronii TaxID=654 RepID=UPI0011C3C1FA|nr:hypothetical protein [Aeromonas veronii]